MSAGAKVLFWLVLSGHAFSVLVVSLTQGMVIPAQGPGEDLLSMILVTVTSGVQMWAYYAVSMDSTRTYAPLVMTFMIVLTVASLIVTLVTDNNGPYIVDRPALVSTVIAAVVSCGPLIWLRLAPKP